MLTLKIPALVYTCSGEGGERQVPRGWLSKRGQQALASSPRGLRACVGQTQKGPVMYWLAPSLLFIPIRSLSISNLIALVSCSKLSLVVYPG